MQFKDWVFMFALVFPVGSSVVMAGTESKDIQALARQVEILNNEVTRLKQAVESLHAIQPTITSLMPEFSERFHVMHYAGEAGDWAVASHELLGLKRLIGIMQQVDPEKGTMVNGFLLGNFDRIDAAIEHKN
jgi:outer membrane murein-binding lipoprotein Lpp